MKEEKKCRCCGYPFGYDGIEESTTTPGVCPTCEKVMKAFSGVELRKSASADLDKYSPMFHKDSYMEVTEWVNGEGVDVYVDLGPNRPEKRFELTYDEFNVLVNLVHIINPEEPLHILSDKPILTPELE